MGATPKMVITSEGPANWCGPGMGRLGTGEYEPIRQSVLRLKPGEEWLKVECKDPKAARGLQSSLLGGKRRRRNSLHGVPISTRITGSTFWVMRLGVG